jgi:hypothetical protein
MPEGFNSLSINAFFSARAFFFWRNASLAVSASARASISIACFAVGSGFDNSAAVVLIVSLLSASIGYSRPAPRFGDRKPVQSARQEANFSRITGRVIISARLWTSW